MPNTTQVLLRKAFELDKSDAKKITLFTVSEFANLAAKSHVPLEACELTEEQLREVVSSIGITQPEQELFAVYYIKAIAQTQTASVYPILAPKIELEIEWFLNTIQESRKVISERMQKLFKKLEVNSFDEAREVMLTFGDPEAVEMIDSLIKDYQAQQQQYRTSIRNVYKKVEELRLKSERAWDTLYDLFLRLKALELAASKPKLSLQSLIRRLFGLSTSSELNAVAQAIEDYFSEHTNVEAVKNLVKQA